MGPDTTDPRTSHLKGFELRRVPRDSPTSPGQAERARYATWLRGPLFQLDFVIDDRPLRESLSELEVTPQSVHGVSGTDFLSIADGAWPEAAASSLRQLAGTEPRDENNWPLEPGRLPLYVCPMCGDLGCGALTVAVRSDAPADRTIWSDFRVEDGFVDHRGGFPLGALGPFHFDTNAYRETLLDAAVPLDALAAEERAAAIAYRRSRGLRGALYRTLRR